MRRDIAKVEIFTVDDNNVETTVVLHFKLDDSTPGHPNPFFQVDVPEHGPELVSVRLNGEMASRQEWSDRHIFEED